MSPTLLVVQHVDHEDAGLVGELARQRDLTLEILRPERGDPLPDPMASKNSIALVLGGPMSVNDRNQPGMDWLRQELDWLTAWHQQRRPVLGICLGAQLLAVAAGGSVQPLQVGAPPQQLKELGLGAIHWVADPSDAALLNGQSSSSLVLHWHGDRIQLPADAILLGSSLHCAEQVFRIGAHAIGLQCHLEVDGDALERWIANDHDYVVSALGPEGPVRLSQDWRRLGATLQIQGRDFFNAALDQLIETSKAR
ncbi:type 1 glutamine amidotransferase [Synechococcus sp. MU1643]|uniref:type 1 glutamine amidotransferase n=1 Tax=Synechococcus sp. MU1643 TaxID=2508349 RepID=UPI001CF88A44|nr:type 1 glutamine amidotransferase [Synechococcus sp. MU1643]MCB4428138.1 type 1 glutamine amidotransferase [Synechococcus sp. MU1643]